MKNNDIPIRAYAPETDRHALLRIWLEASLIAHSFIGEQRLRDQQALIEKRYLPTAESWVACIGDTPAGFISLLDTFVGGIFVAPQRQGLGIGRKLIAHALSLKGELSLEVYTRNMRAMRFYASLGFEELSRRASDDEGLPFENALLRVTK
jgi:putative acetyltransferase